eukprot:TRINITY_DN4774_c0_g1_i2.p1 TRINITY_DN4774_c0_g1~~TRINITY_DN4774_c0_g1_i2.p1  ORF type:complete len:177 (-),score=38.11 TRINITY_DN4774_c0_g1_i2:41-571(-)
MEYTNALLCSLSSPAVREVHLLQEDGSGGRDKFLKKLRAKVEGLRQYGRRGPYAAEVALDRCNKLRVVEMGERVKYIHLIKYVNAHPEWAGEPVLATNADISVSSGFESAKLIRRLVSDGKVMVVKRYENDYCHLLGEYYGGETKRCHCLESSGCADSYLMTYPMPAELELSLIHI